MKQAEICARLPHAGRMCLLERLEAWDSESITCTACSHRDPANPLRTHGRLHAVCGVEYAAQAMALHGSLAPYATAMDGGSAGNAGAVFRPDAAASDAPAMDGGRFGLLPSRGITPSLEGRSAGNAGAVFPPTAMDGGSAENAGAVFPPPAMGYLASVRDLRLDVVRLDDIAEDLRIEAKRVGGSAEGFAYSFEIFSGARLLLAGRAMVKLMNSTAPL